MSLEQLRERVSIGINDAFREEVSLEMQRRSTFMGGIEQAKVLRGPSTAQHDSASLGRVLQVISRSPDKCAPPASNGRPSIPAPHTASATVDLYRVAAPVAVSICAAHHNRSTPFTQYGGAIHGPWKESNSAEWILNCERDQKDGAKRTDPLRRRSLLQPTQEPCSKYAPSHRRRGPRQTISLRGYLKTRRNPSPPC